VISDEERLKVEQAIAAVEARTDAELVTVLAARSDDYRYIPVLWAAIAALLVAPLLVLGGFTAWTTASMQFGVFCALMLLFRIPVLARLLIPQPVRHWRAANMARRMFMDLGLHHTRGHTGVLIFVSHAERYVEVLADWGVSQHVDAARWRMIVDRFVDDVRGDRVLDGFLHAIDACGEILAGAVPKTDADHNELQDRLILLGYD
jgi:putative membrane protein